MSTTTQFHDALRSAFDRPVGGVVGLVDELLRLCPEEGLRLDWQADRCRVRSLMGNGQEGLDLPLRKSVFRAILARVAALCTERESGSVTPYRGQGELTNDADSPQSFQATFTNTAEEQKLELRRLP